MGIKYVRRAPFPAGWAEADDYDAGAEAWSSTPTKEVPSAGVIAKGFIPDQQVDAPVINLAVHATGSIGALVHALMRNWQPYLVSIDGSDANDYEIGGYFDTLGVVISPTAAGNSPIVGAYRTAIGTSTDVASPAKPMIATIRNLGSADANLVISCDGSHWNEATGSIAFDSDVAGGADHTFDFLGDDRNDVNQIHVISSHDRAVTSFSHSLQIADRVTSANVAPAGFGLSAIGCDNTGTYLVGVSTTASTNPRIYRSTNGTTWSAATTPAGWDTTVIHAFCGTDPSKVDSLTGGDVVLATGAKDGEILRSTDQGATWAVVTLPGALASRASNDAYQIAWSPTFQQFMIVNGDFDVAVSDDGSTWTVRTGSGGFGGGAVFNPALADRGRMLAAAGPCFALAVNCNAVRANCARRGVFYTFDLGLNWHFVDFAASFGDNNQQLLGIAEIGGALVAWAPGKVFVSPCLWEAPADLTFT